LDKSEQEKREANRPDRNNRNRNRNRNSKNRRDTEELAPSNAPVSKQVKAVITDAAIGEPVTQQRPAKTPRPPKERESQEARRERQQREREERAAKKAASEAQLQLQDQPNSELTTAEPVEKLNQVIGDENQEAGDDEPRRRRRRGGRNRHRRDREPGENITAEHATRDVTDDFVPVADIASAEQHQANITTHPEVEIKPTPAELNESVTWPELNLVAPVTAAVPTPAKPVEPLATPGQVELLFETKVEPKVETKLESVPEVISKDEPKAHVSEVAPTVFTSVNPEPKITKVEDLQDMLRAAGLELASTDPSKLQHVQMNATPTPPVKKPRVRKSPVEISSEPLELVQTKHSA
jgi:ribonuclease E